MSRPRREKIDVPFASDAAVIEMVAAFERCDWPYARWTHRAHIGVSLCYLRAWPFDDALARVRKHINLYNQAHRNPTGYHETLTVLFMRRVQQYLRCHPESSLVGAIEELAVACDMQGPLRYYSAERLWSAEARAGWMEPDREPLDF